MDNLEIHSRKYGIKFLFYSCSWSGGYIIVNIDYFGADGDSAEDGSLSSTKQPCKNGAFRGETLTYVGSDQDEFNAICRRWYRGWKRNRDEGSDHRLPLRRRR